MHRLQTQRLEAAAANYQKVVDDLEARRSTQPLSETDRQLWRDAYFAFADCRYNEGDYTDAARIYETLTGLFQHEYAGLEAFRMLYICYEALAATNRSNLLQARATIQRALYALNELEETVFKEPNRKTREDWEKLFKRAEEELRKMGGPDPGP
jgi:tetratricopeptide (TPR) repeat protein